MGTLRKLEIVEPLLQVATPSKPLVGICLGMQPLMTESHEFRRHAAPGILDGTVVRLENPCGPNGKQKVPQVCWNRLHARAGVTDTWSGTLLDGLAAGVYMYFCHSFYVRSSDPGIVLATIRYGDQDFCSALG